MKKEYSREYLIRLNRTSLIEIIMKLQTENKLLKEEYIYTCMNCGMEFQKANNELCPYCSSGDIAKEIAHE